MLFIFDVYAPTHGVLTMSGIIAFLIGSLLPVKAGAETMVGKTVTALTPIDSRGGKIFIEGEHWNAVSDTPIEKGEVAEIAVVQGLTLKVKNKEN